MKNLIFKKFLSDTTKFFLLSCITLALIVWIIQAVNFLDFITEDGHNLQVYGLYTLLSLPKIISRVLPFTFFISIFYLLIKYEANNELIIFWNFGITKIKFINTVVKYSLIFLIAQLLFTTYIVPKAQNKARSYIKSSNVDFFPTLIKERKFIDTVSKLTIFIEEKDQINNELKNIFLKDQFTIEGSQIVFAKKGKFKNKNNNKYLVLYDGKFINSDKGKITNFSFSQTEFNLSKYSTKSTTRTKIQEVKTSVLFKCLNELLITKNLISDFTSLRCDNTESVFFNINQELYKRLIFPLYLPAIALITTLLVLISKIDYNYNRNKNIIFVLGIILLVIGEVSSKYIGGSSINILFLSMPVILFFGTYIYLLNFVRVKK